MLSRIIIKNFALIEKEEIEFDDGLNVLSGETGAGKSIIFGALNFVLGERADKSFVRQNQSSMRVEAVFTNVLNDVLALLDDLGVDREEDCVYLTRTMTSEGKTEARINGCMVTASNLKKVTSLLIDVYGQHEHQSLLKTSSHITILDNFAQDKLDDLKIKLKEKIAVLKEINAGLNNNFGDETQKQYKLELLDFQINEIKNASLVEGEEDELIAQKKLMQNSEKIATELQNINKILSAGYNGTDISNALKEGEYALKGLKNIDSYFDDVNLISANLEGALERIDIREDCADFTANTLIRFYLENKHRLKEQNINSILIGEGGNEAFTLQYNFFLESNSISWNFENKLEYWTKGSSSLGMVANRAIKRTGAIMNYFGVNPIWPFLNLDFLNNIEAEDEQYEAHKRYRKRVLEMIHPDSRKLLITQGGSFELINLFEKESDFQKYLDFARKSKYFPIYEDVKSRINDKDEETINWVFNILFIHLFEEIFVNRKEITTLDEMLSL